MEQKKSIIIKKVKKSSEINHCLAIRYQVFVEGQKVPAALEADGLDELAEHYLLYQNAVPAGTARVRYVDGFAKIERVAILDCFQKQGLGYILMQFILQDLCQINRVNKAKLGAQAYAIPFYEKLGFLVCSDEYLDAGIPHKDMQYFLTVPNAE